LSVTRTLSRLSPPVMPRLALVKQVGESKTAMSA